EELNKKIRVNIPLVVRVLCPECQGSNIHCECCNGKGTYKSTRDLQITLEPELLIHKKMYELDLSHFRPDHFVHFKKKKLVFQIQVLG
ncbi:MAG: molecular chaperone DnaJ, partial [Leptospiraceae bacterium]|nr:molecular chaperone DnaJ [Leptospiraceae bacterium]